MSKKAPYPPPALPKLKPCSVERCPRYSEAHARNCKVSRVSDEHEVTDCRYYRAFNKEDRPKWISVNTRMPEVGQLVLVFNDQGGGIISIDGESPKYPQREYRIYLSRYVERWDKTGFVFQEHEGTKSLDWVTRWCPIPDFPKNMEERT